MLTNESFVFLLQQNFDIPNVGTLRAKVLSSIASKFRQFKYNLAQRYIFGDKKDKNPCNDYPSLDETSWKAFKESRLSDSWQVS